MRVGRPLAMPPEERVRGIFAAAEALFGERGYANVTMADIAAATGMSKKTLYVHFADKQSLLRALVESSYAWSETAHAPLPDDPVQALGQRLCVIAAHVLSERHLKLCRLAIGESVGIEGLADTFYRRGIQASRRSLISAVKRIAPERRVLALDDATIADMLFGATIGRLFIHALLTGKKPQHGTVVAAVEQVTSGMFTAA